MSFTRLKEGRGAASSDGYTVRRLGSPMTQFYIEYTEGERQLHYYLENLAPGTVDVVRSEEIGPWLKPHAGELLSASDQMLIA